MPEMANFSVGRVSFRVSLSLSLSRLPPFPYSRAEHSKGLFMFCFDGRQMVKTKTINYSAHKVHLMRFDALRGCLGATTCERDEGFSDQLAAMVMR